MRVATMTVEAGHHGRHYCPVSATIGGANNSETDDLVLWDREAKRPVPFQLREEGGKLRVSWIIDDLPAEGVVIYELKSGDHEGAAEVEGVTVEDDDGALRFSVHGAAFTRYNYHQEIVRPYFYPVYAADETGITRNWPMVQDAGEETNDHPHHKGMYTAQGEVNGVDNWAEGKGHGYQLHLGFDEVYSGPVAGGFAERLAWTDADRKPNMDELRTVTVYRTPAGLRIVDYDVTLTAAHGKITLGDTKEAGLLSVRVASRMDAARSDGGTILNGFGGVGEAETWGKRAPWCDYSGPIGVDWYGICFMDHPNNPRHPTYWHVRDYGLMTANCFGVHHFTGDPENRHDLVIPAGQSRTWKFRALIHAGRGELTQLTRCYHDFANPPTVLVS